MRRFRVTGPESEPPFQFNISWIHPRGVADAPEVASQAPGPGDWLYRLEKAMATVGGCSTGGPLDRGMGPAP
jgi:hypothetical protein